LGGSRDIKTLGVIYNRFRNLSQREIDEAIQDLVGEVRIREFMKINPSNQVRFSMFRTIGKESHQ
jgi:hypothetical protein